MPARIPPHNARLDLTVPVGGTGDTLLLHQEEVTTYRLLIESFRVWDETKRIGDNAMEDPQKSWQDGTGYLYAKLLTHIDNAEKMTGVLRT